MRHYEYSEIIQIATGQKQDRFKHTDNCAVCGAKKATVMRLADAAKKAMEEI